MTHNLTPEQIEKFCSFHSTELFRTLRTAVEEITDNGVEQISICAFTTTRLLAALIAAGGRDDLLLRCMRELSELYTIGKMHIDK
jgi:hypothetical protein